jgi:hypothetical protein
VIKQEEIWKSFMSTVCNKCTYGISFINQILSDIPKIYQFPGILMSSIPQLSTVTGWDREKPPSKLVHRNQLIKNNQSNMSAQSVAGMSLLTSIFALTGFILNWFAVGSCDFVHLSLTFGSTSAPEAISLHFGIWSYQAWTVVSSLGEI